MWSDTLAYRRYLEPYLPAFFPEAARHLELTRADRLLDVACGPGTLAFRFAPYVGALTGVEPEAVFVTAAQARAARRGIPITLVHGTLAEMPEDSGPFDVATIGRAHWYLPPAESRAKLERLLTPKGRVLICWSSTADPESGPWAGLYRDIRKAAYREQMRRITSKQFLEGSAFVPVASFSARQARKVSVEDLLKRALAFPGASPAELGPRKERYLARLRAAITPFAVDGMLPETIMTFGAVFARR